MSPSSSRLNSFLRRPQWRVLPNNAFCELNLSYYYYYYYHVCEPSFHIYLAIVRLNVYLLIELHRKVVSTCSLPYCCDDWSAFSQQHKTPELRLTQDIISADNLSFYFNPNFHSSGKFIRKAPLHISNRIKKLFQHTLHIILL